MKLKEHFPFVVRCKERGCRYKSFSGVSRLVRDRRHFSRVFFLQHSTTTFLLSALYQSLATVAASLYQVLPTLSRFCWKEIHTVDFVVIFLLSWLKIPSLPFWSRSFMSVVPENFSLYAHETQLGCIEFHNWRNFRFGLNWNRQQLPIPAQLHFQSMAIFLQMHCRLIWQKAIFRF